MKVASLRVLPPCPLGMGRPPPGCVTCREGLALPSESTPTVTQTRAAQNWVLIKNPRYGDLPSEPEYIWVEEEKIPTTFRTLLLGKKCIVAPPEVVAKYGSPPGGGRSGPRAG